MESIQAHLAQLREKIAGFGKENMEEMLHAVAEGARLVTGRERIRIYLEDLTRGALSCAYACGRILNPLLARSQLVGGLIFAGGLFLLIDAGGGGHGETQKTHELLHR